MRISSALIIIGPVMLIGALPAVGKPALRIGSEAPTRLAAGDDAAADRNTYVRKAQDEMQEWQRKLHEFGEQAEAKGREADSAAEKGLNDAWIKAKDASGKLQAVGTEGWQSAKASYEKATHDLAEAWRKIHPGDN
jgi:hypothetical protein